MTAVWVDIEIKNSEGTIKVFAPYHPQFIQLAKGKGGKWNDKIRAWTFPNTPDTLPKIREALNTVWGWNGEDDVVEVCDVEIIVEKVSESSLWILGREVRRPYRDSRLRLPPWTELGEEGEAGGGGSRKYPAVEWAHLIYRCVPLSLAERLKAIIEQNKLPFKVERYEVFNVRKIHIPALRHFVNSQTFAGGESERLAVLLSLTYRFEKEE